MTLVREEWKIARFEGEECRWRVLSLDLICGTGSHGQQMPFLS